MPALLLTCSWKTRLVGAFGVLVRLIQTFQIKAVECRVRLAMGMVRDLEEDIPDSLFTNSHMEADMEVDMVLLE
jgi:hypothetical protein